MEPEREDARRDLRVGMNLAGLQAVRRNCALLEPYRGREACRACADNDPS